MRPAARLQIDHAHSQKLRSHRVGDGDVGLLPWYRARIAEKLCGSDISRFDQHISGGNGFQIHRLDYRRGQHLVADDVIGIAPADERKIKYGIRIGGELTRAARKNDQGQWRGGLDALDQIIKNMGEHQTAAQQQTVNPALAAHPCQLDRLLHALLVRINQHQIAGALFLPDLQKLLINLHGLPHISW
ncbi:MAG: hypothetical protein BWY77_01550 [bacterium ADurb.Bin431]|nr:MAG: hypothetical protein BWY77_01550 [bacterium ADurb.Bin431]